MATTFCEICGVEGPTKYVEFYQNIGLLLARRTVSVKQRLCRPCIGRYFRSYTLTTLFLGWWGTISLCITPLILINNVGRYLMALQLPPPSMAVTNTPIDAIPPSVGYGSLKFKLIYGAIVCAVGLGVLAYYHADFMEKHAPALNAKLHGGDISDEADATYRGNKFAEDVAGLSADANSKDWVGYRAELLSRQHYLLDLNEQNAKFQTRAVQERAEKVDTTDPCEKLALDEFIPAINDFTTVENEVFSLVQSTATPSADTLASLNKLSDRESKSLQGMRAYGSNYDAHGCK
jgi:hypothetical protein